MRVLVACEESQAVCKAFRALGHEAYSCDIEPCSGGYPEWHLQVDALELLKIKWDLIIAHPPCTYLTNAGAVRMRVKGEIVPERYEKAMQAKEFFMKFLNANCDKIAVENPTPMKIVGLPPYSQAIQPYQFGHPYSKRTCLWLKGLPPLIPTKIIDHHTPWVNGGCKDANGNYRRFQGRKERDPKTRSKTFPGIAQAMAEQWGGIEMNDAKISGAELIGWLERRRENWSVEASIEGEVGRRFQCMRMAIDLVIDQVELMMWREE